MEMMLKTNELCKTFKDQKAVNKVSLNIPKCCVYGLLGPNGAGKSTTLKMITGIMKPTAGEIIYDGKPWSREVLEEIGALIENPPIYENLTARENLEVRAILLGTPKSRIDEVLKTVSLTNTGKKKAGQFSLGMKQRAGLALSLLHKPKILILDEPTNGLDPVGIKDLRDILKKLVKEQNIAVLVSSHILSEMELMCDRVVVINEGKFVKTQALGNNSQDADGERKYAIKTNAIEDVQKVLKDKLGKDSIVVDGKVIVDLKPSESSNVLKTLVLNNVEVETLNECENTLESIFFDVTKEGKKDE